MGETPEDLVRRSIEAFEKHDTDGVLECCHPECEFVLIGGFESLVGSHFDGHDGLRRFLGEWFELVDTSGTGVERLTTVGDRVLAFVWSRSRSRSSGAESDLRWGAVYSFRDDLIARAENYYERSDALAALGLSAWPGESG